MLNEMFYVYGSFVVKNVHKRNVLRLRQLNVWRYLTFDLQYIKKYLSCFLIRCYRESVKIT